MILTEIPAQLKRVKNPPKQLFYKGNLNLLSGQLVSIVGSRRATSYTKECVFKLSKMLSKAGVCVVSGGALGVDIEAHRGALPNTIGVFGNGLDKIYPKSNAKIINEIYSKSLAISEYEPSTPPLPHNFLQRNRIVVGLSKALVVAQADLQSGSMQSAKMAIQMGVDIYVLPQRIGESDGTNALLASGKAKLIDNFENFVMKFGTKNDEKTDSDEIVNFCKNGANLDEVLARFGDKIYEYELLGRVKISGLRVLSE
ncbi:MAG: DNA-processing protein DprA [Campylobacter sp.]